MKRTTSWLAMAAVMLIAAFAFHACENKVDEQQTKGEVVLTIKNLTSQGPTTQLKSGIYTGLKSDEGPGIPVCSDGTPSYIMYWLTGESQEEGHKLPILQNYGGGELTVMEKLEAGVYTIERLEVYDENGNILWASPTEGSTYDELFDLPNNVSITFEVSPFTKTLLDVDVLCWQDYDYINFGYNGFDLNFIKVKTICFFGDVCTKFFREWHGKNSPYADQAGVFHDFPAIFSVDILDADGAVINDTEVNSNASWLGTGEPLCVEYADHVGVAEDYTAVINLMLPDGTSVPLDSIHFTDDDATVAALAGEDGIIDFIAGGSDCLLADADFHYALPWVPLPSTVEFTLVYPGANSYFELGNIIPDVEVGEFVTGATLAAWCGNKDLHINIGRTYLATVAPYYAIPDTSNYASVTDAQWAQLNWIANEASGSVSDIQHAIWYVLGDITLANSIATAALTHSDYIPPLGGFIVVLVDPIADITTGEVRTMGWQLAIVRFDP